MAENSDAKMSLARRPFRLGDIVTLVAATACGLAFYRSYTRLDTTAYHDPIIIDSAPVAVMYTLALVLIRLQKPRPRFRRLSRQPGMAGCSSALIDLAGYFAVRWPLLHFAAIGSEMGEERFAVWFAEIFGEGLRLVGFAVMTVWLNMLLGRSCVAEKSWIDRAGRLLSIDWIVISLATDSHFSSRMSLAGRCRSSVESLGRLHDDHDLRVSREVDHEGGKSGTIFLPLGVCEAREPVADRGRADLRRLAHPV